MELRETISRRYAAKHFDGRPIPDKQVHALLELVRWAPSGLNIQPWRVKVVSDPAVKQELLAASYDEPQIMSCSHLLVFCADTDFAGLRQRLLPRMEQEGVPEKIRDIVDGIAGEMSHMPPEAWRGYATANTYLPALLVLLCPLGYADDQPLPKWRYSVEELLIP